MSGLSWPSETQPTASGRLVVVNDFLDQVEAGADVAHLYFLALAGALVIPDMCGALESPDGNATGQRYRAWFDEHVAPLHQTHDGSPFLSGDDCYRFRCSLLHQGTSQHPDSGFSRIMFIEPGTTTNVFHMCILNDALNIEVRLFCLEVVNAARVWTQQMQGTEPYDTNFNAFVRRYPNGLLPYIGGVPVIS